MAVVTFKRSTFTGDGRLSIAVNSVFVPFKGDTGKLEMASGDHEYKWFLSGAPGAKGTFTISQSGKQLGQSPIDCEIPVGLNQADGIGDFTV